MIVQVVSTIAIEAAIFDTPVVNVSFDGRAEVPFVRSARRYAEFTHWDNIRENGAIRDAATPDDMIAHVRTYLDDPALDREARQRVAKDQCQFLDGKAAERVARFVSDEVAAVSGSTN